jgi:hypothetical protein
MVREAPPATLMGWVRTMILTVVGMLLIFAAPFVLSAMALSKLCGRLLNRRLREPPSEG